MQMVMPVSGGPRDDTLLRRRMGDERENGLERAARGIGAAREGSRVPGPDSKDAEPIKRYADGKRLPGDTSPERCEAAEMNQDEGYGRRVDDVVMIFVSIGFESHSCDLSRRSLMLCGAPASQNGARLPALCSILSEISGATPIALYGRAEAIGRQIGQRPDCKAAIWEAQLRVDRARARCGGAPRPSICRCERDR